MLGQVQRGHDFLGYRNAFLVHLCHQMRGDFQARGRVV